MAIFQKKVSVGKFLKKGEDYKDRDIVTVASEGQDVQGTYGVQHVFLVKTATGAEGNFSFNQTSINNLIDAYGEDSMKWVGKTARVWLILQSVSGKMQKVPYLTHPDAEMVENANGFGWEIPGRQTPPPVQAKPAGYPAEEISPDDIPF